jgi:TatD DNase family protein
VITEIPSSLKTAENLLVVKTIPVDRIMVESDAPWCEIRPSHAGFAHIQTKVKAMAKEKHSPDHCVKSRNEPLASRLDQFHSSY